MQKMSNVWIHKRDTKATGTLKGLARVLLSGEVDTSHLEQAQMSVAMPCAEMYAAAA